MRDFIGLTGAAQAGKDTVGGILVERYGYTRIAFADGVRDMALAIDPIVFIGREAAAPPLFPAFLNLSKLVGEVGWDEAKQYPDVRRLLQRVGTEAVRDIVGPNTWIELAMRKASKVDGPIVFTDVRFPNEALMVQGMGGVIVRVLRDVVAVAPHLSELAMVEFPVDWEIKNYAGLDVLERQVGKLVAGLPEAREAMRWRAFQRERRLRP